jgi:3-hydroxyisobutyrate dehydrogenase-like beta-hydroxyacid dehydrogenase
MSAKKKLGFIGLGMMGGPMALNLVKAGNEVLVLDTNKAALDTVVAAGGKAAKSPKEIASQVETVYVSLPTPSVVRAVALGKDGLIEGTKINTFVDLSTTGAVVAKQVVKALTDKGIRCLDAPVSGGARGATNGTLAIMVSGPKATYEAEMPTLETIGKKIFYIGETPGAAQTVKVGNNYLSAVSSLCAAEALVMGAKAGLDPEVMINVFNVSSGRNNSTEDKFPAFVLTRDFKSMRTELLVKDITLCTEEGESLGVPMWLANTVRQFLLFAVANGHAKEPTIGLIRLMEQWAGVEARPKGTAESVKIDTTANAGKKFPVGYIGLGQMGGPMAMNMLKAGFPMTVYDASPKAMQPFLDAGAKAVDSPKAVADAVEHAFVCLPMPEVVREVALGETGLIHGAKIKSYVDLSTTGAVTAREVAKELTAKGIDCLDSPVSGGVPGARAGTVSLMMSGNKEVALRLMPALMAIGKHPFYLGEAPGLGQTMKVANNYLSAAANISCAEALVMGCKAGVDPKVMLDVVNASSGRSDSSERRYPTFVLKRDFKSGFRQQLLHKDIKLCMQEAAAQGTPMWLGNTVLSFLHYAMSQGTGDEVSHALVKHIERWAGVEVRSPLVN